MTTPALTICSVSYHHAPHLRLNIALVAMLNPASEVRWIIGENTPAESELRLTAADMPSNVEVVPTESLTPIGKMARHHHITALSAVIERVQTRFMLVLDPDFYAIWPGWHADIADHMQRNELALFGAPWNPRHHRKYRYFPTVHFTMVDRERFGAAPYTPGILDDKHEQSRLKAGYVAPGVPASALRRAWRLRVMRRLFPERWKRSWAIQDTGSALFARYWAGERIAHETLTPVFQPADFEDKKYVAGWRNRALEVMLPEYMSYLPKRRDSFSASSGFIPQTAQTRDWEQFLWRDNPFGFHMRGHTHRASRDALAEVESVRAIITRLIGRDVAG